MASTEERYNEAWPSKYKKCDVCRLKALCSSPCGHKYCYRCLHLQKKDKCCLVESCHFDVREVYDEMYQYTLRTATENELRILPYCTSPVEKCCEKMALVLLMECNHTLCLSCESPIIDYTVRPNHLLHFKCCKCDVSVLRDYVCRFKQTDLKSISMMKIELRTKCDGCRTMDRHSHKILLKRCGHAYCIKCSEAMLESSKDETSCKVCRTTIPTECFNHITNILKRKETVIASAFFLQNSTEGICSSCLELKVCQFSFQECRHNICFGCLGERNMANGFFKCPDLACTTILPSNGIRDSFACQKYVIKHIYPGGLYNEGLCCYRNALFQVLARTNLPELCPKEMAHEPKWLESLLKILEEIRKLKVCPRRYLDDFSRCYYEIDRNFPPCTVNDSLSLFLSMINNIKEAGSGNYGYEDAVKLFQGIMWSEFFCQRCERSDYDGADVFFNLTFPMIVKDNDSYDEMKDLIFDEVFKSLFSKESVKLVCERCEEETTMTKTLQIKELPDILVIQLGKIQLKKKSRNQRFLSKSLKSTRFEEHFEVPYATIHNAEKRNGQYELFGTIVHIGGLEDGHYYAFVKKENGKWYRCADTVVSEVNISCVKDDSPYILFYRRIQSSK
ncbi:uncharacterized protein LOC125657857 [Ostrea edulis]|uniref:uncharacterized protein LOC125657857 n=1 Tax=Ostrea edulis TaxID=37623 RepID=UPI0024AFBF68|nr:uncharacterized protein LOC125657857 [Ostrea edulis]